MSFRSVPAPLWFALALVPMVASQLVRLQQDNPTEWVLWDYAGRLGAIAVLFAIPAARAVAFRRDKLQMEWWEIAAWSIGLILADHYAGAWIRQTLTDAVPASVFGSYPETHGVLRAFDMVIGLALVAWHEEIVFRRCARDVFARWLGDGTAMIVATSVLFGLYHWWGGAGTVVETALMGGLLMLFYLRAGALWPVVLAHYLVDIVDFF